MTRARPTLVMLLVLVATGACGGGTTSAAGAPTTESPDPAVGSPGPALVVERFLRAANANDLETMAELFGSSTHTIAQLDGQSKAERRMYVLATLLRHDDFQILGQQAVPGRLRHATELRIELRKGDSRVVVPHLVVRKSTGGWIIEKIDIEQLTTNTGQSG